jgi:hypothetical protein
MYEVAQLLIHKKANLDAGGPELVEQIIISYFLLPSEIFHIFYDILEDTSVW